MAQVSAITTLNAIELYFERFKHVPEHHATPVMFQVPDMKQKNSFPEKYRCLILRFIQSKFNNILNSFPIMKVVYNFIYADPDGKPREFQMPVNVTEDTDADLMYDLCMSYLNIGHIGGTPLHAVSTSSKYPNYCFTSTTCDDECQSCRSKKLNNQMKSASKPYNPQSLEGKKIYIYEGKFGKVGQFGTRIIQKSYILPAPALLTDNLIQDFKKAMNQEPDGMGWELLGVTLVHELNPQGMTDKEIEQYVKTPEGNLFTPPQEEAPKERMIWARISDENEDRTAWVPALVRGEQVLSAVGELDSPDNPEDTREFIDCPIPGYRVVKDDTDPKELVWLA